MKLLNKKLEDVAEVIAGQSPPSSSYNNLGNGVPLFQGMADFGERHPKIRFWCTKPTKISNSNDILISVRAPVGPVIINNVKACIGRGLGIIRVKENISLDYVYYYLRVHEKKISDLGVGSTFKAITQKNLKKVEIIIPEKLSDQIRIAEILGQAEALIAHRKKSICILDELLKSTFLEMFGDPVRNEKGWEIKTIEQLVKKVKHSIKRGPFGGALKKEIFVANGYLVYEQYHALNNDFTFERYYINEEKFQELKAFEVYPDDIIISCSGVYLGKLAIIPKNAKRGIINQALLKISLDQKIIDNKFFVFLFRHNSFKNKFFGDVRGSGVPNFPPMPEFKKFQFIYPPIELQNKFVNIIEKVEALNIQYQQSLTELQNMYGVLSQKAFKGELKIK